MIIECLILAIGFITGCLILGAAMISAADHV